MVSSLAFNKMALRLIVIFFSKIRMLHWWPTLRGTSTFGGIFWDLRNVVLCWSIHLLEICWRMIGTNAQKCYANDSFLNLNECMWMKTVFVYSQGLERVCGIICMGKKGRHTPKEKNFETGRELFNQSVTWQIDSFPHKRYFAVITGGSNGL